MEPTRGEVIRQQVQAELDRITRENDRLREFLIHLHAGGELSAADWHWIDGEQVKHRKEDLVRLDRALRDIIATNKDGWVDMPSGRRMALSSAYERLGRVVAADASKPLEPQLGFDPDSI